MSSKSVPLAVYKACLRVCILLYSTVCITYIYISVPLFPCLVAFPSLTFLTLTLFLFLFFFLPSLFPFFFVFCFAFFPLCSQVASRYGVLAERRAFPAVQEVAKVCNFLSDSSQVTFKDLKNLGVTKEGVMNRSIATSLISSTFRKNRDIDPKVGSSPSSLSLSLSLSFSLFLSLPLPLSKPYRIK